MLNILFISQNLVIMECKFNEFFVRLEHLVNLDLEIQMIIQKDITFLLMMK
jgi:hypothetical protein